MLSFFYLKALIENKFHEKMSRVELLKSQQNKFRKLVKHAYAHSPYYRKIISENNISLENPELEKFPILTKEDIYNNFDQIVTDPKISIKNIEAHLNGQDKNQFLEKYNITKTSGTSGVPGYCIQTDEEVVNGISTALRGQGKTNLKTKIAMVGFTKENASSTMTMNFTSRFWISRLLLNYKLIDIEQSSVDICGQLNEFQPAILCGYAKVLLFLADLQKTGVLKIKPHTLQSGGEQLFDADRRYIESVFQAPVNNQYGSTEHLVMGVGHSSWQGMYLCEDRLIFELLSDDTLITNLFNFTLPMIRYRSKDVLVAADHAPKSFPFLFIENQIGRADEIPVFTSSKNGEQRFHPICFDRLMTNKVQAFQIFNIAQNEIEFRLVMEKYCDADLADIDGRIQEFLTNKDLTHVKFKISVVEVLAKNPHSQKTLFWNSRGVPV